MHSHAEHLRSEREKVYGEAQEGGRVKPAIYMAGVDEKHIITHHL
jgi:hypothetical protein